MVTRMTFVGGGFIKGRRRIFDAALVHISGYRHRPLVLTDGGELRVDRSRRQSPSQGLLQEDHARALVLYQRSDRAHAGAAGMSKDLEPREHRWQPAFE